MEAVIFVGLQASGKSSFYQARFFDTHVRISLDLLRTRNREQRLVQVCLETRQPFVVDNTNPTPAARARYIGPAQAAGFAVVGYYFPTTVAECLARNQARAGARTHPGRGPLRDGEAAAAAGPGRGVHRAVRRAAGRGRRVRRRAVDGRRGPAARQLGGAMPGFRPGSFHRSCQRQAMSPGAQSPGLISRL